VRQFAYQKHHAEQQSESAPFHMQHESRDTFGMTTVHDEEKEKGNERTEDGN
jgi:hypothetical protein